MTVKQLIDSYYAHNPKGHFFDKETLKFFGEKKSEMHVLNRTVDLRRDNKTIPVIILSAVQRDGVRPPRVVCHYFNAETFDHVETVD